MTHPVTAPYSPCCAPPADTLTQKWMPPLEKVSLVALSALAFYSSPPFFIPAFAVGTVIGILQAPQSAHPKMAPSCTQGILEQVTGVRLPPLIALATNVAITACHALHHTTVFVPIIALFAGAYTGRELSLIAASP